MGQSGEGGGLSDEVGVLSQSVLNGKPELARPTDAGPIWVRGEGEEGFNLENRGGHPPAVFGPVVLVNPCPGKNVFLDFPGPVLERFPKK